jgi:hypothetical protein
MALVEATSGVSDNYRVKRFSENTLMTVPERLNDIEREKADGEAILRPAFHGEPLDPEVARRRIREWGAESQRKSTARSIWRRSMPSFATIWMAPPRGLVRRFWCNRRRKSSGRCGAFPDLWRHRQRDNSDAASASFLACRSVP